MYKGPYTIMVKAPYSILKETLKNINREVNSLVKMVEKAIDEAASYGRFHTIVKMPPEVRTQTILEVTRKLNEEGYTAEVNIPRYTFIRVRWR